MWRSGFAVGVLSAVGLGGLVLAPTAVFAQPRAHLAGTMFVIRGVPSDVTFPPAGVYDNASTDGLVRGGAVEAGVVVAPALTVAVEAALPERRQISQLLENSRARTATTSRYRDSTLFALLRWRSRGSTVALAPEFVVGGGLVRQNVREQSSIWTRTPSGSEFGPPGPEQTHSRTTWGVTGGLDLDVRLGPRVRLLPSVRGVYTARGDLDVCLAACSANSPHDGPNRLRTLGIPELILRAGVGLRFQL